MTARELQITKALLNSLHDLDGGQTTEPLLHADVNLRLRHQPASLAEFNAALDGADIRGWVTGVASKFGGRKWNVSDAGEAARLEMR
jgi:hypothetical protein